MKRFIKHPLAVLLMLLAGGLAALSSSGNISNMYSLNEFIQEIITKYNQTAQSHPEERVYLHLDKPFYKPGESIWFKAYLRNGTDMKASAQSDILHVELINPKGSIEKEINMITYKGLANGDFQLEESAAGGLYKIKAYTNWQKNEPQALLFEKEIQVQAVVLPRLKMKLDFDRKAYGANDEVSADIELKTLENNPLANKAYKFIVSLDGKKYTEAKGISSVDGIAKVKFKLPATLNSNDGLLNVMIEHEGKYESISRSVPILLNKIVFSLFPEGGDLVAGLESNVAFKALNEFGKPADVEGFVENSKGEKITTFKSYHNGMGAFSLKPLKDEKYIIKITQPKNIAQSFELPEALPRGYGMNVKEVTKNSINLNISSTEFEELYVIAQVRGKIYHTGKIVANYGTNILSIPTDKFPIGVAQLTLFDNKGIARAERLAFVNKNKQLKVKVETDKEKYLPREKVKLTLRVTDERDIPMPADFSLSVVDDKLLSFADDRSGNILSQMFLEKDIKEKVEEASFYFDPKEEKADKALDYLLMTSGWRRFTWEQIMENNILTIAYQGEKTIASGIVVDAETQKPIAKAKVEVLNKNIFTETDNRGYFILMNIDLTESTTLKFSGTGYTNQQMVLNEYSENISIHLYNQNYESRWEYKTEEGMRDKAAGAPAKRMKMYLPPVIMEDAKVAEEAVYEVEMANDEVKEKKEIIAEKEIEVEAVILDDRLILADQAGELKGKAARKAFVPTVKYYRARQFPVKTYGPTEIAETRSDFRSTIYWNGNISTDKTGKAVIEFYNSDEITSFKITAEGISTDGSIGRTEKVYFTQLPFSMSVKAPVNVTFGDVTTIPLTFKNNTDKPITGSLNIIAPEGLKAIRNISGNQIIPAKQAKTIYLDYLVLNKAETGKLQIAFNEEGANSSCINRTGPKNAFVQEIKISPKGFPAAISFSGQDLEKEYQVTISNAVDGSLKANFTAYPSVVTDLLSGIESIIREPYGCFEQTSTSNYPNILVKKYIQETQGMVSESKGIEMPQGLNQKLDNGYKKLISYETKEKGYEWFGGAPAHEALTAYGLMQFQDMKGVYNGVDDRMIERTATWLMGRRDGNGGFKRSGQALDQFGRANDDVTNAYIVYALSEAGYRDIQKEIDKAFNKAIESGDPYQLALVANTMFNIKDAQRGSKAIKALEKLQKEDGSWTGLNHSITCSQGKSLSVETSSLAVMSLIKSGDHVMSLNKGVEFIVKSRDSYGGFGSTQGTVLALKALTEFAKHSKKTDEDGTIEIFIDGKKVAEKEYKAGEIDPIAANGFEKYLTEGKHTIKVRYKGVKNALPYSFGIAYNTFLPKSSKECKVSLTTEIKTPSVAVGETARLKAVVSNTSNEGLPMVMAIIGIPAGMSAQPWQLKEMQEKQIFDFYEVRDNNVFIYYRQMKPQEVREINLDLKAEIAGEYESPASSAYLYYTSEYKSWSRPERIIIKK